jgi:hypothetical protein
MGRGAFIAALPLYALSKKMSGPVFIKIHQTILFHLSSATLDIVPSLLCISISEAQNLFCVKPKTGYNRILFFRT